MGDIVTATRRRQLHTESEVQRFYLSQPVLSVNVVVTTTAAPDDEQLPEATVQRLPQPTIPELPTNPANGGIQLDHDRMLNVNRPQPDDFFEDWKQREALAESMIPLIGKLYREQDVSVMIYGRNLVHRSPIDIMKAHRFVRQIEHNELSEFESFPMIQALAEMELRPMRLDVGKLTVAYMQSGNGTNPAEFLQSELAKLAPKDDSAPGPQDVVLYGFGRIGRLVARLLIEKAGSGNVLRLRAVVVRRSKSGNDLEKRASLLRRDSVHGSFRGTIRILHEQNQLVCNGTPIQFIYADQPTEVDYCQHGIKNAIVVDNTGVWRDEEGLGQHLQCQGVQKVILTAPGRGSIPNIVYGVNDDAIQPGTSILSAASCTTNAIVPILKAVNDEFGILKGHVETVHAYTNDQNLIDNYHSKTRRGRSAALNMVLTETGAAKAVAKAIPDLAGKLTGNAIRVPTPNVSMAILNLRVGRATNREEVNEFIRRAALHSPLQQQIGYTISPEAVSSDFVGTRHASIFDSRSTIVSENSVILYCWYDNEFGYSCQVLRCVEKMAGANWVTIPPT